MIAAKNISQWGKTHCFSVGNPHRKRNFPVWETHTTAQCGKPTLLPIYLGGDRNADEQRARSPPAQLLAPGTTRHIGMADRPVRGARKNRPPTPEKPALQN